MNHFSLGYNIDFFSHWNQKQTWWRVRTKWTRSEPNWDWSDQLQINFVIFFWIGWSPISIPFIFPSLWMIMLKQPSSQSFCHSIKHFIFYLPSFQCSLWATFPWILFTHARISPCKFGTLLINFTTSTMRLNLHATLCELFHKLN